MDSKVSSRASIIVEVYNRKDALSFDNPLWQEFFRRNDLGIPAAMTVHYNLGNLTEKGMEYFDSTWVALCKVVMVDSEEEYEFLDDMIAIGVIDDS